MTVVRIDPRFTGPPGTANGGWTAGLMAGFLPVDGPVEVTLRKPPPIGRALDVLLLPPTGEARPAEASGHGGDEGPAVVLRTADGGPPTGDIAVARPAAVEPGTGIAPPGTGPWPDVPPVALDVARAVAERYVGLTNHPWPSCVVCSPARAAGDGFRIFPGPVADGSRRVAAVWTPDASLAVGRSDAVAPEAVWAALDCPTGWAWPIPEEPAVLASFAVDLVALPRVGEDHVVVAAPDAAQGRRRSARSTLYDRRGRVLGRARAVWVVVDPATFGRATQD